jgi:hypothetical protein
MDGRP